MEIHKDIRWRVRGDLEFDTPKTVQGRRYRVVDTRAYTNSDGKYSGLLIWAGTCSVCSRKFTFETNRAKFYPTATCELHRGQARFRKR